MPRKMHVRSAIPSLAAIAVTFATASPIACNAVLGIEDLTGDDLDAGGAGGAATTSTTAKSSVGSGETSTASGTTASSSSGGACTPGMMTSCYDGPAGTEDVGICKPGMATCGADGGPTGMCNGEVLPKMEDCSTPDDDDCNGKSGDDTVAGCVCLPNEMGACPTGLLGVCATGMGMCDATGKMFANCVAPKPALFDDCATPADEDCDGKTPACSGAPTWVSNGILGNSGGDDAVFGLGAFSDGSVIFGGVAQGTLAADGYTISSGRASFGKIGANGTKQFAINANMLGGGSISVIRGVASVSDGSSYLTGNFNNTFSFALVNQVNSLGAEDVFLAHVDGNGQTLWLKSFGSTGDERSRGVAVDHAAAHVFVVGSYGGTMSLGASNLTNAGGQDAFVACFDLAGNPVWARGFGDASDQVAWAVAVVDGDVVVAGSNAGKITFANMTLASAGLTDAFVIRFKGADGSVVWAKQFGDAQAQEARSVAAAPNGDVVVSGDFAGTINFGGAPLTAGMGVGVDAFATRLAGATGAHVWSEAFGGPGDQLATAVTADAGGEVILSGSFAGSINLGAPALVSAGAHDLFVAKLAGADGSILWKAAYGDVADQQTWAVATDPKANIFFGGGFESTLKLSPVISLNSNSGYDRFVVELAP